MADYGSGALKIPSTRISEPSARPWVLPGGVPLRSSMGSPRLRKKWQRDPVAIHPFRSSTCEPGVRWSRYGAGTR